MDRARPSTEHTGNGDSLGNAIVEAQPQDPVGLVFARSRVAAGLFGAQGSSGPGRFQLLNRLGAGGMGVIYAAYDPQLERAVAVKVVHVPAASGSDALAEAKALARLSHPNIVTIFDYGFVDEHLYIVMELIVGQTLRTWAKGRTQRDIVKAYRQAGEALAAAHSVALVHRDFKPDNAIMGVDGRVRVVDFGLACEAADPTHVSAEPARPAGTPGYMAPEQARGGAITAATDQYGFCTALRDALREQQSRGRAVAAVPRWLEAVIDRGRSPNPGDRFPSMHALLHSLSRDPAATRRRWVVAGALLATGGLAVTAGSAALDARSKLCEGAEDRITGVWGIEGLDAALERVASLNPYANSLRSRLRGTLSAHSRRWADAYRDTCLAGARSTQSTALTDRRMACLERNRAALRSVAEVVRSTQSKDVANLVLAVQALPDPDACNDLTALLSDPDRPPLETAPRIAELRETMAEARIQVAAGRSMQVRPLMEDTVSVARTLSYKPVLSESLLLQGHALMGSDEQVAAIAPLREAFMTAFEAGLPSLAVEAWARWAWARGTSLGGEDSLSGLAIVEAVAANPSTAPFSRALLYNNVGCVELALQRREGARMAFERASHEAREVNGPGSAELLNVKLNLGLITADPALRDEILAAAAADNARLLGDDHPETLDATWFRGRETVRFDRALQILAPTCAALQEHEHFRAARCWLEVGFIRRELDDQSGAVSALQRAAAVTTAHDSQSPLIPFYLLLWQGDGAAATHGFTDALAAIPPNQREPWWDRLDRAELELGLGRALRSVGRLERAKDVLSSSLDHLCAVASKNPSPYADRRLGRARAELAKVLLALHQPQARAAALASSAAFWLRQASGDDSEIRELERISGADGRGATLMAKRSLPEDLSCSSRPVPLDSP